MVEGTMANLQSVKAGKDNLDDSGSRGLYPVVVDETTDASDEEVASDVDALTRQMYSWLTSVSAHLDELRSDQGPGGLAYQLDEVTERVFRAVATDEPSLTAVTEHLAKASGKGIRPILALLSTAAVGGERGSHETSHTAATLVEVLHLASLYHDDVMDKAATRRGVESANSRFGNDSAILAGDALLARSIEISAGLAPDQITLVGQTLGALCVGQALEVRDAFRVDRTIESYYACISNKTAVLMATACELGAVAARRCDTTSARLRQYGLHLGMAFQLVDDVLDLTATAAMLGKPACNDIAVGVYTLPVLDTLRREPSLRHRLGVPLALEDAQNLQEVIVGSGAARHTLDTARAHARRATAALDGLELQEGPGKALRGLAERLIPS